MMRYIRTHSEIYDMDDLYECEELVDKPYATKKEGWCIYKESIIQEADTIEELCDEFVVLFEEMNYPTQFRLWHLAKKYKNVFGAIWTNKGLVYVAKINEEGKLELL